ncbi:hypothetical protein I6F35_33565 [Bradyrhizobium sp. BRP22]|uniref:hypothetical protein n=1 Tax=Bradyrhizobium sp. BRP22 TaxID=2793821 RepID=UPI001CD4E4A9|nr:hypothetical protein [Bradyrhizobium sp. BRP22]MCA1458064.1 hypothetical protein [Bradyrhizobium sp. BRP22]
MSTNRKPARRAELETLPEPTENQMDEAMLAFEKSRMRHQLLKVGSRFVVRVLPDMLLPTAKFMGLKVPPVIDDPDGAVPGDASYTIHYFADEPAARHWRERAIIRECIAAGLRARP